MRLANQQDVPGIVALAAAAGGSGRWGREQRTGPEHPDRRCHVEVEGDLIVGYGCVWRRKDTVFGLDAVVRPDHRGQGVGRRLLDQLFIDLADFGATAVEARVDADHKEALVRMVRVGFIELNRLERVRLDLDEVETSEPTLEGIDIRTLAEARDPDGLRALDALVTAAFQARKLRQLEVFTETPNERFAADLEAAPADGCFIASAAGVHVGFSGLTVGPEPGTLTAFMTAIAPGHRHRGIATALKQRTISYAKRNGYRAIFSNSPNRGMQDLNELLGFKRAGSAEIRLGRRL